MKPKSMRSVDAAAVVSVGSNDHAMDTGVEDVQVVPGAGSIMVNRVTAE